MTAPVLDVESILADLDEWYSCHAGDDDTYQDWLERNSIASFYTALGSLSNGLGASIALSHEEASNTADAGHSFDEVEHEVGLGLRPSREHPELDDAEEPAQKRTRSELAGLPPLGPTAANGTKSSSRSCRVIPPRARLLQDADGAARASQAGMPSDGPIRVSLSVQPDGSSVQLRVLPAPRFGNVPFPDTWTSLAAIMLGPESNLALHSLDFGDQPCPEIDSPIVFPRQRRLPETGCDPDAEAHTDESPSDNRSTDDPVSTKDQTRVKRQAEGKGAKSSFAFPNTLLYQVFSSLRASGSDSGLRSATVQELGTELLRASGVDVFGRRAVVAASQNAVVMAGYVQAAAPLAGHVVDSGASPSTADEASEAAHRLSAAIFRNIIRASDGGAGASSDPSSNSPLSPRDTAFPPKEPQLPQRDQMASVSGTAASATCGVEDLADGGSRSANYSPDGTPREGKQPLGEEAITLLLGLSTDAAASGASEQDGHRQVAETPCAQPAAHGTEIPAENSLIMQGVSAEVSEYGVLPTPALEQCDSPVTIGAVGLEVDGAASDDAATSSAVLQPTGVSPAAVAKLASATVEGPATASPRTLSKKAYGTLSNLVKKLVPDFRDSAVMGMMATNSPRDQPTPLTGGEGVAPAPGCEAAAASAAAVEASTSVGAEQAAAEQAVADGSSEEDGSVPVPEALPQDKPEQDHQQLQGKQEEGEPSCGQLVEAVDADATPAGPGASQYGDMAAADGASRQDADGVPVPSGNQLAPGMFVFGQEQPKAAKHPVIKPRPTSAKGAAAVAADAAASLDAAGRKRKADVEVLPSAKLAVPNSRAGAETVQPKAEAEPEPAVEAHGTAAPLPTADAPEHQAETTSDSAHATMPDHTDQQTVVEEVHALPSKSHHPAGAEPSQATPVTVAATQSQEPLPHKAVGPEVPEALAQEHHAAHVFDAEAEVARVPAQSVNAQEPKAGKAPEVAQEEKAVTETEVVPEIQASSVPKEEAGNVHEVEVIALQAQEQPAEVVAKGRKSSKRRGGFSFCSCFRA